VCRDCDAVTDGGRLFPVHAEATGKERSPMDSTSWETKMKVYLGITRSPVKCKAPNIPIQNHAFVSTLGKGKYKRGFV